MSGNLVEHALESLAAGLDEFGVEATDCLLFGWRWDDNARIVVMEGGVEPEEVTVTAGDGELGLFVGLRGGLCADRVDNVTAR